MSALFATPLHEELVYDDDSEFIGWVEVYPSLHCAFKMYAEPRKRQFVGVGDPEEDLMGAAVAWIKEPA